MRKYNRLNDGGVKNLYAPKITKNINMNISIDSLISSNQFMSNLKRVRLVSANIPQYFFFQLKYGQTWP